MREFLDAEGRRWIAEARQAPGLDYKGQWRFVARPEGAGPEGEVILRDIRWNSERTAERTLRTMSDVELRRRLRSARGRSEGPARV